MTKEQQISKSALPDNGVSVAASRGNKFTRIHMDLADDGITLAMVGAASAAMNESGKRHSITLERTSDGITLSMVGAATATN